MRRSEVNALVADASACFHRNGWALPPNPKWDVTDFGLGDATRNGLVLVNLAEEPEYCEKLMYAKAGMWTPMHTHLRKKEDIICRWGRLRLHLISKDGSGCHVTVPVNGEARTLSPGDPLDLTAGERVTLVPGVWHAFVPLSEECILGEVSTANDDANDNLFDDPNVGRFPGIEEDEPAAVRLVSDP